jgi:tRNA-2-methylthio-N6-dimethylallyladenosine synthase
MRSSKKYNIWTIGCQMNEADSRYLASRLESLGYTPTPHTRDAGLVVINTCVVRQQAEDKIYTRLRYLGQIKRERPDIIVALMGCLVGHKSDPSLPSKFPFVDVFMPPSDISPLVNFLRDNSDSDDRALIENQNRTRDAFMDGELPVPPTELGNTVSAFVPVVLGCSHACSFCIIPYRRGAERSRPQQEIVAEVRRLADEGIREITLLGQIVDRYGLDLDPPTDLAALIEDVARIDGILRIRFLTSHPNWFTERLLDIVAAGGKVCPYIELPVQAGNDEVLARMKRGYSADDFRRLVARIRQRIPDAGISTDIIVGFPGETEEQFIDTFRLINELQPDMIRIAKYSERPQTLASRSLPDNVTPEEKERRRVALETLLADYLERKHRDLLGRDVEVLVEARARNGRWRGRTPQGKLVFFDDNRDLLGQIAHVRLDWTGPFSLIGSVAAEHRTSNVEH